MQTREPQPLAGSTRLKQFHKLCPSKNFVKFFGVHPWVLKNNFHCAICYIRKQITSLHPNYWLCHFIDVRITNDDCFYIHHTLMCECEFIIKALILDIKIIKNVFINLSARKIPLWRRKIFCLGNYNYYTF